MERKAPILITCIVLLFASLACQMLSGAATTSNRVTGDRPPADSKMDRVDAPATTEAVSAAAEAEATAVVATAEAANAAVAATSEAAADATEVAEATEAAAATKAADATEVAAATEMAAAAEAAATQEVLMLATAQAEDFAQVVERLRDENVITSPGGVYHTVEDFEENWAQIGWYQWWSTGYAPANFVIRAHTQWESASRTADWYNAGCGFVFREQDEKNHYMIYLALDGNVYMKGYVNNLYRELGREYYGKITPVEGEADVMLAVDGEQVTYFVNDEKVFSRQHKDLKEGSLALTLVSGTNKDYGTRCAITGIELWNLDE